VILCCIIVNFFFFTPLLHVLHYCFNVVFQCIIIIHIYAVLKAVNSILPSMTANATAEQSEFLGLFEKFDPLTAILLKMGQFVAVAGYQDSSPASANHTDAS
jgi:hypothetical protein